MSIFAKIGLVFAAPFLAVGAWWGGFFMGHPPQAPWTPAAATSTPPSTTPPVAPVPPANPQPGPMQPPATSVSLQSISPSTASVGDTVVLFGSGFTADNTVLFGGNTAAKDIPASRSAGGLEEIVFTVPSALAPNCPAGYACPMYMRLLTAGTYQVSVQNGNGTSNAVVLEIVGGTAIPL